MKKIGLVGGISWSSTIDYYRYLNEEANKRLGGLNFAECIIYSVNFDHFRRFNKEHNWDATFGLLFDAAIHLKGAGAEVLLLGANTAHIVAERISEESKLPIIDVRDATAAAIIKQGLKKIGLLGTVYTMELDFYKNRLTQYGIEAVIPERREDREYIEQTLLYELGKGIVLPETRARYVQIIGGLIKHGAEGIVLGCTEIPLLISQEDVPVPVFNTTLIHAQAAVAFCLET